jgi:hypothetical protein
MLFIVGFVHPRQSVFFHTYLTKDPAGDRWGRLGTAGDGWDRLGTAGDAGDRWGWSFVNSLIGRNLIGKLVASLGTTGDAVLR